MQSSEVTPAFVRLFLDSFLNYRDYIPLPVGFRHPWVENCREPRGLGILLTSEKAGGKA